MFGCASLRGGTQDLECLQNLENYQDVPAEIVAEEKDILPIIDAKVPDVKNESPSALDTQAENSLTFSLDEQSNNAQRNKIQTKKCNTSSLKNKLFLIGGGVVAVIGTVVSIIYLCKDKKTKPQKKLKPTNTSPTAPKPHDTIGSLLEEWKKSAGLASVKEGLTNFGNTKISKLQAADLKIVISAKTDEASILVTNAVICQKIIEQASQLNRLLEHGKDLDDNALKEKLVKDVTIGDLQALIGQLCKKNFGGKSTTSFQIPLNYILGVCLALEELLRQPPLTFFSHIKVDENWSIEDIRIAIKCLNSEEPYNDLKIDSGERSRWVKQLTEELINRILALEAGNATPSGTRENDIPPIAPQSTEPPEVVLSTGQPSGVLISKENLIKAKVIFEELGILQNTALLEKGGFTARFKSDDEITDLTEQDLRPDEKFVIEEFNKKISNENFKDVAQPAMNLYVSVGDSLSIHLLFRAVLVENVGGGA